jgi:hypothetical protein
MKRIFTLLVSLLAFSFSQAQNPVPNPSFEFWIDANNPTSWTSSGTSITKVTGLNLSWAAQGTVLTGTPNPVVPTLACINFPITAFYQYLQVYYKTNLIVGGGGQDKVNIEVTYLDNSNNNAGYASPVPATNKVITASTSTWTAKQVTVLSTAFTPTKATIAFTILPGVGTYPNVGSYFIIDSVKLSNNPLIGINEIEESSRLEIYPNPVRDFLNISTNATKSMQITLSDALGNIILKRSSSEPQNGLIRESLNLESLSSGIYFLMLTSDKKTILRRVMVD